MSNYSDKNSNDNIDLVDAHIGEQIRKHRLAKGFSEYDLITMLQEILLRQQYKARITSRDLTEEYKLYESGKKRIPSDLLVHVARIVEQDIANLFPVNDRNECNEHGQLLIETTSLLADLSCAQLEAVKGLVHQIAESPSH